MTDPIADMLVRIKNAQAVKKDAAAFGYSKIKFAIAEALARAGYIGEIERKGKKSGKLIAVKLLYGDAGQPKVTEARRVSKPSRRVYRGWREIYAPKNGFGLAIYSTPKGIMTDREARKNKLGGEVLMELW